MQSDPGLAQRMRAAAITVAATIAASQRGHRWQARRALLAAATALGELGYYIHFTRRAGFLGDVDVRRLAALVDEVSQHLDPLLEGSRPQGG